MSLRGSSAVKTSSNMIDFISRSAILVNYSKINDAFQKVQALGSGTMHRPARSPHVGRSGMGGPDGMTRPGCARTCRNERVTELYEGRANEIFKVTLASTSMTF